MDPLLRAQTMPVDRIPHRGGERVDGSAPRDCGSKCPLHKYRDKTQHQHFSNTTAPFQVEHQGRQAELLYTPIKRSQLRILRLHSGSRHEELVADLPVGYLLLAEGVILHESSLSVEYDALSYCWGAQAFSHSIRCNGVVYPITTNLFHALQQLRHETDDRNLWIDALCINQYDPNEKSEQILNMMQIFGRARTVIAWLGAAGQHSDETASIFALVEIVSAVLDDAVNRLCYTHRLRFFIGLKDLVARQWFRRVWIKQEYFAARKLEFLCGDRTISASMLSTAAATHMSTENPFNGLVARTEGLIEMLHRTSGSECSDLRDKVYGVLGMVENKPPPSKGQDLVAVDYTRSISAVYADTMICYITPSAPGVQLSIFKRLCYIRWSRDDGDSVRSFVHFGGEVDGVRLPSWCPNWSRPFAYPYPHRKGYMTETVLHCSHKKERSKPVIDSLQGTLIFEGHVLATVVAQFKPASHPLCEMKPTPVWTLLYLHFQCNVGLHERGQSSWVIKWQKRGEWPPDLPVPLWAVYGNAAKEGDLVVASCKEETPLVVRRHEKSEMFEFVGCLGFEGLKGSLQPLVVDFGSVDDAMPICLV